MVFWCWNIVVQLSGALQTFMASWQGPAQLSPVLDLTLARETDPDPPKSMSRLNKKLWDLMSFQFIRNIKKLFLVQKRVSVNGFPCESQSFASPNWDCACDRASVSPSGQLERDYMCTCVHVL